MEKLEIEIIPSALKKIANYQGIENQSIVALEELSELQKEICKMRRGIGNKEHLSEEIADVEIMLEQIKELYEVDPSVIDAYKLVKVKRQLDSMDQYTQEQ